ncbi:MAG: site-specific DNA-methyltransferase [Candidatus Bathyarchaeota archaeon]|nr:site-specific DNA-methyltransferase [Candidatus Bathyarchaeota archaeon]
MDSVFIGLCMECLWEMQLQTLHKVMFKTAEELDEIPSESVDLVVTSPPYPMIEMWDTVFAKQNPEVSELLQKGDGYGAFELMHRVLDKVWKQVYRVLKNGGFACINIGDALRRVGGEFNLYPNHSRILSCCLKLGFSVLPEILWRKQTNAPNKFMGSGMLPAGAYVTLEHEFILILRKGKPRRFCGMDEQRRRRESAFFWEERNEWFTDVWVDLKGAKQNNIDKAIRERSAAFPFELPYRLINMFSIKGDVVLDPFLGTGTTMVAAMAAGRNSVGYEVDPNFKRHIFSRFESVVDFANQQIEDRLRKHVAFVKKRTITHGRLGYVNKHYGFPVLTQQETEIFLNELRKIEVEANTVKVEYSEEATLHPQMT